MSQRWLISPGTDPILVVDSSDASDTVTLDQLAAGRMITVRRQDSAAVNTTPVRVAPGLTLDGVLNGTGTIGPHSEICYVAVDGGFESYGSADLSGSTVSGTLPVLHGGTGAAAAADALTNLGAAPVTALNARTFLPDLTPSTATSGTFVVGQLARLNCNAASFTRTLPTAASAGASGVVAHRRTDTNGAYTVTVSPAGTDTINASASARVSSLPEVAVSYVSDGVSNWSVYATDTPTSQLSNTYAQPGGALRRWKTKLAASPSTAVMVLCGDSTSDAATSAGVMHSRLHNLYTQQGEALYGMATGDYYTDGVTTNTSSAFASATANFTAADKGRLVYGKGFPLSTTITAVADSGHVTLGANLTATATNVPFFVGRHIINGGNNGMTLSQWFGTPSGNTWPYNRDKLVSDNPDLIIYSWLFNDIRQGGLGLTVDACVTAGTALLQSLIDWTRTNLPNADILLRMPNAMLTANTNSNNFVTDGTNINPAGQAQIYSTALRRIYLSFIGKYPNVDVIDIQGETFGTRCVSSHPLMNDQLHPNTSTTSDVNLLVRSGGGYAALADALAARVGFAHNTFGAAAGNRVRTEFIVYDGPSANTLRLLGRDIYGMPAPNAPVFKADSLYINGVDSPISLSSATIDRTFSSTVLSITGLTGDWSPYIGNTAVIAGSHAPQTTGDRQQIFIDLPSIAAGATVTQAVTVTGVGSGQTGTASAVIAAPGNTFTGSGLFLLGCYPTGTNAAVVVVQNPTAGAIDVAGESWTFWVVR